MAGHSDDPKWQLDGLAKRERAKTPAIINYKGLSGPFAAFGRAFVAHRIGESIGSPKQIGKYTKPIARLRDLVATAERLGICHPSDITLEVFDETASRLTENSKSQYSLGQQLRDLKWVYDALSNAVMLNVPFDWQPHITDSTNKRNRIDPNKSGRPLTDRELQAIAHSWRNAETPRDVFVRHCQLAEAPEGV